MPIALDPFRFVLIAVAGWMNQRQLQMIEYLREENRVLREQLGERRLRLTDDQRRRLAAKAKGLTRIELTVRVDNNAARQLYAAFGFVSEGLCRRYSCIKGEYTDCYDGIVA